MGYVWMSMQKEIQKHSISKCRFSQKTICHAEHVTTMTRLTWANCVHRKVMKLYRRHMLFSYVTLIHLGMENIDIHLKKSVKKQTNLYRMADIRYSYCLLYTSRECQKINYTRRRTGNWFLDTGSIPVWSILIKVPRIVDWYMESMVWGAFCLLQEFALCIPWAADVYKRQV